MIKWWSDDDQILKTQQWFSSSKEHVFKVWKNAPTLGWRLGTISYMEGFDVSWYCRRCLLIISFLVFVHHCSPLWSCDISAWTSLVGNFQTFQFFRKWVCLKIVYLIFPGDYHHVPLFLIAIEVGIPWRNDNPLDILWNNIWIYKVDINYIIYDNPLDILWYTMEYTNPNVHSILFWSPVPQCRRPSPSSLWSKKLWPSKASKAFRRQVASS